MKAALLLTGLLGLATPSYGGELIQEIIPADARWLAHIDLEAMQQSVLFKLAREHGGEQGIDAHLAEAREELGFDPLAVGRSVTMYSSNSEPENGVAVLVVGAEANQILDKLKQHPGYRAVEAGGHELHSWSAPEGGGEEFVYAYVRRFEGVANQLVYISDQRQYLVDALQVLDGARPSLSEPREGGLTARPSPGSIAYLETSEGLPRLGEVGQVSAVAALARGVRFELGETNGMLRAELSVQTKDERDAQNIASTLQGVCALAGLFASQHGGEELHELVDALRFTRHGNEVGASVTFETRRLLELAHALEELGR